MTVKELINKLIDLQSPNEEIGISISKMMPNGDEIIYVGAKGELRITGQEQVGDPKGYWLEGYIKDDMEKLHHYSISSSNKEE